MIRGADELSRRLIKLERAGSVENTIAAVSESIKFVQGHAKELCPTDDGELRQSIYTEVEVRDDVVYGICYTNKEYAPYVEMGTGPRGEASHEGISPAITPAYSQSPWWMHESQVDAVTAEKYGWFYIDTPEGRFYQSNGQAAQPFMYPALKNNEDKAAEILGDTISAQFERD